jgi:hypothetical protein
VLQISTLRLTENIFLVKRSSVYQRYNTTGLRSQFYNIERWFIVQHLPSVTKLKFLHAWQSDQSYALYHSGVELFVSSLEVIGFLFNTWKIWNMCMTCICCYWCHFCVDVQVNILSVLFAFILNSEVFLTVNYFICVI